ncbi:MAG: S-methyl-5-thioribose-1-phosphate isomerase [Chromatiales bacterium]|nr:S-methyl-5-thioribose-1-phosphate isomerase [Chromatiales bacterium]
MTATDVAGVQPIRWDGVALELLDQRRLPREEIWLRLESSAAVASAIRDMVVRGAPAIGIAAAYGVVLAARSAIERDPLRWREALAPALAELNAARPTAVNLAWAIARMRAVLAGSDDAPLAALDAQARRIHGEDLQANLAMGDFGAQLIGEAQAVLTHCNAGALATGGYGTALGVIRSAWRDRRIQRVFADETRPWLQGARLTAWELVREGIPVDLIAEGAAAALMAQGRVQWVVVGSDRIAANGDVANKIGTYALAVLARHHGVRFMVAAPVSTIDPATPTGADIPIETRAADELLGCMGGGRIAADGAGAWNPVFDVTPAALVDAIVTERGVIERPDAAAIAAHLALPDPLVGARL